jgi:hypothetical protein
MKWDFYQAGWRRAQTLAAMAIERNSRARYAREKR